MWSAIKSILKDNKTKCIIVEDGIPKYVILPFSEYQQLQKGENNSIVIENTQSASDINWEIQDIVEANDGVSDSSPGASTIRIEDLPF